MSCKKVVLKKFLLIAGMSLLCLMTAFSQAADPSIRQKIEEALSARHPEDSEQKADWWRSLGPDAPKVIIELYGQSKRTYQKVRLIDGLAWFNDPQGIQFLKKEAEHSDNSVIQVASLRALGIAKGMKEEQFLKKFLEHRNDQVRMAAAQAFQNMRDSRAQKVVSEIIRKESDSIVGRKLKRRSQGLAK